MTWETLDLKKPGAYQLRIDATRIAKIALFDVRMNSLGPASGFHSKVRIGRLIAGKRIPKMLRRIAFLLRPCWAW